MKSHGAFIMEGRGINIRMDRIDKELLNLLQDKFPIESQPFLALGLKLDITEAEVIERISRLKKNGYIRRIGGIFDSRKLGYCSTLCAVKIPRDRLKEVAAVINKYNGVTHNYIRNHSYNMWFTLIVPSVDRIGEVLDEIRVSAKIENILSLPATKVYKIKAKFDTVEG